MLILGISAFYHDSAAALVEDGRILAAAQEERFTRKKHDNSYPRHAIAYCLEAAGISSAELDYVVFYEKPWLKFERLLETYLAVAPRGFWSFCTSMPLWLREKLFQKELLADELRALAPKVDWPKRLRFAEHHQSHAASAFYASPFAEAAVLTMDGVGEWATTTAAIGRDNTLAMKKSIHFPHSLGLLYSAFTAYCGFRVNSGEYKLMGLAPYGKPVYRDLILEHLIDVKADGSFRLDMGYFNYAIGLSMTSRRFHALFGGRPRKEDEPLEQRHMDLAASIQSVLEEVVLRLTRALAKETGMKNLCLAGGVALNCVANSKILKESGFEQVWIQPAAGDAGGALGAALVCYHDHLKQPRNVVLPDAMQGSYLGPAYAQGDAVARLQRCGAVFRVLDDTALFDEVAGALASGAAVGWFSGRMEFGPRALGARSILADARSPDMQRVLNEKVKKRESFRPFAPSVIEEHAAEWFDLKVASPYMSLVAGVKRKEIPAVTHIDGSARLQTVSAATNPRYHALLSAFHRKTGCPMLVNTSFNVRGEPIVATPEDAFRCFMGTDIDMLVIEHCLLLKSEQTSVPIPAYAAHFAPD